MAATLPKLNGVAFSNKAHACYPRWAFTAEPIRFKVPGARLSLSRNSQCIASAAPVQQQVLNTLPDKKYHPSPLSQTAPTTYAVIEVGGVQMFVEPGKRYRCNRLKVEEGSTVQFPRVLMLKSDGTPHFGAPYLSNATVQAEILEHGKGDKVIVYKMKPKKHYRKKYGHRQYLTTFQVTDISVEGAPAAPQISADTIDKILEAAIEKKKISADSKDTYKKQLTDNNASTQLKTIAELVL